MLRDPGKLALWALLALPAALLVAEATQLAAPELEDLLPASGELSARLLIAALLLTPLRLALPRWQALGWLLRRRRALGVAAFGYAALHTLFYVLAMGSWADMHAELGAPGIWTGWLAALAMAPAALISNDWAMRALRAAWTRLQRLAYPAALLTLAHWLLIHDDQMVALAHFAPLALLELWRFGWRGRAPGAGHTASATKG